MSFTDDLKAQLAGEPDHVDVPFTLNGTNYVLRFTQMNGWEWADVVDRHPARPGVALDRTFGYNLRAVTREIAPKYAVLLREGEPVTVDAEDGVDEWADLLKAMSGSTVQRVCNAVFSLNEAETIDQVVEAAKKVLRGTGKTSS